MARCLNSYSQKAMHEEHCEEDVDDEDLDDDDVDGYDGLSDYDDDIPGSSGYGSHSFGNNGGEGRSTDFQRHRSISEGGAAYHLEAGEDNRRDHHNQLERKRRASIKTSYNDLREVIPGLRGSKASRAVILQRAVECIEELVKLNRDHTVCVETLKRQNDLLDSRVQELQRLVQRMDGEETCNTPTSSSPPANTVCPNNNVALRLISSTASGVPMYRCMPQDALQSSISPECPGTAPGTEYVSSSHVPVLQSQKPILCTMASYSPSTLSRANTIMHFVTNTNTMSAVGTLATDSNTTSLVSSSHSAFSPSVSSSDGSSTGPARSLSQRSSPGGLSSSSNTSSNPTSRQSFRIDDDYSAVSREINSTGSLDNISTSVDGIIRSDIRPVRLQSRSSSSPSRPSSPPPILSTVPTLLPATRKSDSPIHSSAQSLNSGSCNLQSNLSGRPKRRKFR
ncbi:helix-loop-helix zipper protein [Schistosoma japonicum]|uniref:Putative helix-loop-helix zipper protein n=3 Tax=Schistosoma japonicum TaxID=6182 RepID=C1L6A5_SCHJA|nr:helix-loop-helix zipper protein [Schistosoma japonicum]KAH8864550.1 helix-loop-helix zipper protein [Schistosoma japonicum]CAX70233.1 putative helix-loop-helix zipper protein [Schistosoma japonicum]CAX74753.1 putative helix-loop-helix zipper protein [Schistosoma japonicum]